MDLISQMPKMLSGDDINEALKVFPPYDESIKNTPITDRLMALDNIYRLYVPTQLSLEIYAKFYISIVRGLREKDSMDAIRQRNQNFRMIKQMNGQGIISGADSFTVIGASGIGKTSAIAKAVELSTAGKILEDNETGCKIIPCIQTTCPFDCSVKNLLFEVLRQIDAEIGTNYFDRAVRARATTDIMIGSVSTALLNHVAVLVIDEIQNIVNHRAGNSLIGVLTQLINNSGITVVMVGIPESEAFFQKTDYLARRSVGLRFEKPEYDDSFINFCRIAYGYQYTKTAEPFNEKICQWLYQHSDFGTYALVIALLHDAQEIAILNGCDCLSIATLEEAYKKRYRIVQGNKAKACVGTRSGKGTKKDTTLPIQDTIISTVVTYSDTIKGAKEMNDDMVKHLKAKFPILEVVVC